MVSRRRFAISVIVRHLRASKGQSQDLGGSAGSMILLKAVNGHMPALNSCERDSKSLKLREQENPGFFLSAVDAAIGEVVVKWECKALRIAENSALDSQSLSTCHLYEVFSLLRLGLILFISLCSLFSYLAFPFTPSTAL